MQLDGLDTLIAEAMAEFQVPGLSLAVITPGALPLLQSYGMRDVEQALPVTPDTQFVICSITKSFTAAGIGLLVDEGRLTWTTKVRDVLPEFRLHDPVATERVMVQDLLCHHSGLPRHDWVHLPGDLGPEALLAALRHLEPSRDIRETFQYSNLGYLVAGTVAARISGLSWEEFTRERIMAPLGMVHIGFSVADLEQAADSALPYMITDAAEPGVFVRMRAPHFPIRTTPAGAINAAASDMARYMPLFLPNGGTGLLSAATLRALATPRVHTHASEFAEIGDYHYGFGLAVFRYRDQPAIGHSGGWVGWATLMTLLPERGIGVAVLTNRTGSPVPEIVTNAVFDRLLGIDPIDWLDRFRTRRRAFAADRGTNREARQSVRKTASGPTRPLAEYVGEYDHPGYGRISIAAADDALHWRFRTLSGALAHRHYDVFEVPETDAPLAPSLLAITFLYDREGNIDRLTAPFEPAVAEIVFTRVPGGDVLDRGFIASCAGTYRSGATTHVVTVDAEGRITLAPSGQPMYRLAPYRDRTFSVEGVEGFRVEFVREQSGGVERLIFHQPNGTFVAQRVRL